MTVVRHVMLDLSGVMVIDDEDVMVSPEEIMDTTEVVIIEGREDTEVTVQVENIVEGGTDLI